MSIGGKEPEGELFQNKAENYGDDYNEHLLEQYKQYVEMADRVSSRRALANTFFLTISSALLSADFLMVRSIYASRNIFEGIASVAVSVGSILVAVSWVYAIGSYRQLNAGKFRVIHDLESKLPASPYQKEWKILGEGKTSQKYVQLTTVERVVPLLFISIYLAMVGLSLYPLFYGFP